MRISEILDKKITLSFEVFPPKSGDGQKDKLFDTIDRLKELEPDFISVTYGAGGSNARDVTEIAGYIKRSGMEPLAHITGGVASPRDIDELAAEFKALGVCNVLALRGDKPVDFCGEYCKHFRHATDLLEYIRPFDFCAGAACYPEGHSESESLYSDLKNLKKKNESGAEFFITQLFYDNSYYYRLVSEAKKMGIDAPIIAGIMPLTSVKNLGRIRSMCGSTISMELRNMIEVYGEKPNTMREVGINFAVYQITDLIAKGARGIHIYTMNNPNTAAEICARLKNVIHDFFET